MEAQASVAVVVVVVAHVHVLTPSGVVLIIINYPDVWDNSFEVYNY